MWLLVVKWWKPVALVAVFAYSTIAAYGKGLNHKQAEWDAENACVASALAVAFAKSATETEEIRKVFIDYKAGVAREVAALESDVAVGRQRLRFKGRCVPDAATVPGRIGSGTAELDATARPAYFALRRGLEEQHALLNFCRSELKKRSAQ